MIKVIDVGSKMILQTEIIEPNTQPKFKRMYVRYNAQKVGFLVGGGCKPLVGLDGCHLRASLVDIYYQQLQGMGMKIFSLLH